MWLAVHAFRRVWAPVIAAMVSLDATAADSLRELSVHQSRVQNGVKVMLQKVVIGGTRDRRTVSASFRITDPAGRPLTLVRNARMTLVEARASSPAGVGTLSAGASPILFLTITDLRDRDLQAIRHIALDLQAAKLPLTHAWKDVPVQSSRDARPQAPVSLHRGIQAKLSALYLGASSSLLGNRATPTVIAEVQESAAGPLPAAIGFVRLDLPGARCTGSVVSKRGHTRTYEVMATYSGEGLVPRKASVIFYSSAAVTQALKRYRFVFSGIFDVVHHGKYDSFSLPKKEANRGR